MFLYHFIAKNATAHKVNSFYTLAISYCTFCVGKHTILGPAKMSSYCLVVRLSVDGRESAIHQWTDKRSTKFRGTRSRPRSPY